VNNDGKKDSVRCSIGPVNGSASGNVAFSLIAAGALATVMRCRRTAGIKNDS
jgi:hypothetical protein